MRPTKAESLYWWDGLDGPTKSLYARWYVPAGQIITAAHIKNICKFQSGNWLILNPLPAKKRVHYSTMSMEDCRHSCYYCGHTEICTRDHFIPKSKGGTLKVWACRVCQTSKSNLMPEQWIEYIDSHHSFTKEYRDRIKESVNTLMKEITPHQS